MGENALRLSDNKLIKIGRTDSLWYLRYEDRYKVKAASDSIDPCTAENIRWPLSLPDEDHLNPGDYESHEPHIGYDDKDRINHIHPDCQLSSETTKLFVNHSYRCGVYQLLQKDLGLMLNVTCHHGLKHNINTKEVSFFWNGKKSPFCLSGILNDKAEIKICFTCIACREQWSVSFVDIQHYILSEEMKFRLFKLCSTYWEERNPGKDYLFAMTRKIDSRNLVSLRQWTKEPDIKYAMVLLTDTGGHPFFFRTIDEAYEAYLKY